MLRQSLQQCKSMIEKVNPDIHEFEVSYLKISIKKFIKLILYLKKFIDIEKEISLDIIYNIEKDASYRCTVLDINRINKLFASTYQQPNTRIFSIALSDPENILIYKKKNNCQI